ncbi:MAG: Ig domain-containing protein [Trueperaceae bacterium]|nr:Ig domain-containing protein [Trueperaceae bacterium]
MSFRFWRHVCGVFTLMLVLGACTEELGAPSEALRLLSQRLDTAFLGEPYSADIRAIGGVSPYQFRVERGDLPPGLSLQGGTIRGVPTELGRFTFTVAVSDTNLSQTFEEYTLQVTEAPPATLVLNVPETELREATRIRVEVADARELQAFRTLLSWDERRFQLVADSVRASRNNLALFAQSTPGRLNVDVAVLGAPLGGNQFVFEFSLEPLAEPSTVEVVAQTEFSSRGGEHAFSEARAGRRPPPPDTADDTELEGDAGADPGESDDALDDDAMDNDDGEGEVDDDGNGDVDGDEDDGGGSSP